MNRYQIALGKTPPVMPKFDGPGVVQIDPIVAQAIDTLAAIENLPTEESQPRNGISQEQRESIVALYMQTNAGRETLGASMIAPLEERINYNSIARRIFQFEILPAGALPIYDDTAGEVAFDADGESIITLPRYRLAFGTQALVPVFGLSASPEIPLHSSSIRQRRFALIERMQDLVMQTFRQEEDRRAFRLLDRMIDLNHRNITTSEQIFTPGILLDVYALVEANDLRVSNIYMNATTYSMVRRWGRDVLDANTSRNFLTRGIMASIWGAQIIVTRTVPVNMVYVTAEPQFVGRIFQRSFNVVSADDPANQSLGWHFTEQIGMCTVNSHGVARLTFSNPLTGGESTQPVSPNSRRTFLHSAVIGRR
jgi:hypothetical protein